MPIRRARRNSTTGLMQIYAFGAARSPDMNPTCRGVIPAASGLNTKAILERSSDGNWQLCH